MLWLLATLAGVTISWGIAHRLKAVDPAANCLRAVLVSPRQPPLTGEALRAPGTERRSANLERGTLP
jgi:hypothetical protein